MDRGYRTMKYASGISWNFNPDCWLEVDPVVTQHLGEWKYPQREAGGVTLGAGAGRGNCEEERSNEVHPRCRRVIWSVWVSERLLTTQEGREGSGQWSPIFKGCEQEMCCSFKQFPKKKVYLKCLGLRWQKWLHSPRVEENHTYFSFRIVQRKHKQLSPRAQH